MSHKWNSDRPGKVPGDDALNRTIFAQRLAKEVSAWRQKDSLVISLNGDWGVGKSTLKNLILYYLTEQSKTSQKKAPVIVEFNPWQWSGQDKLLDGFFNEIGSAFRSGAIGDRKTAERLARFWEGLRVVSCAGAELADRLQQSLMAFAALSAGGIGAVASYIDNPTWKASLASGSLVLITLSGILGVYAPLAEKFGSVIEWQLKKKQPSLEELRNRLRRELQELEQPLLVVIDDIDRLTKREVRLLVQLIKANADFPNVVYLLLYQKSIVADALGDTNEKGQEFLKKIVQVELEVPSAPDHRMRNLFGEGLQRILKTAEIRWDKERWRRLFESAVWPYFRTPRDIKRFLGVFEFYFEGHVTDGILEVNPIDLVLLETLRVFDTEAYEAVSRAFQKQRNIFLEIQFEGKEAKERFQTGIKGLINRPSISESDQPRLRALLIGLFPQGNESFQRHEVDNWARDLRICDAHHFPKYFELSGEPGDISASTVSRLLKPEASREQLREIFELAIKSESLVALFERLRDVVEDVAENQIEKLLIALFEISDELPALKTRDSLFASDIEREIPRICYLLLKRLPDSNARAEVLRVAVPTTEAITGPVLLVSYLTPSKDYDGPREPTLVESDQVAELQKILLPRMWAAARSGKIWSLKMAAAIIYRLRDWAGEQAVREWVRAILKTPKLAMSFLNEMLQESHSSGTYGTRTIFYLRPHQIELFAPLESLIQAAEPAAESAFQKAAIRVGKEALRLQEKGENREELFVMSFDDEGKPLDEKKDPFRR